jgi:hypothetical protein
MTLMACYGGPISDDEGWGGSGGELSNAGGSLHVGGAGTGAALATGGKGSGGAGIGGHPSQGGAGGDDPLGGHAGELGGFGGFGGDESTE